jgi:hypothetical protein
VVVGWEWGGVGVVMFVLVVLMEKGETQIPEQEES